MKRLSLHSKGILGEERMPLNSWSKKLTKAMAGQGEIKLNI